MKDTYQLTKDSYEEHAEGLYLLWKDSNLKSNAKIEAFISMLPPGGKILDVGAGFGKDLVYFLDKGFECVGVDSCKAFIEKATELCPRCHILEMDFLDMEFEEHEFDGVWARGTLFHLTKADFRKVLGKIQRFLKPGGIFYLQMIEGSYEGVDRIASSEAVALYSYYRPDELKEIMLEYGFLFTHEIPRKGWLNHCYRSTKSSEPGSA